jgi:integrase
MQTKIDRNSTLDDFFQQHFKKDRLWNEDTTKENREKAWKNLEIYQGKRLSWFTFDRKKTILAWHGKFEKKLYTTAREALLLLKSILILAEKEGYVDTSPLKYVPMPPLKRGGKAMTNEESQRLLKVLKEFQKAGPESEEAQCAVILEILHETGARKGEITHLSPAEITGEGIFKKKTKSKRKRTIWLTDRCWELLEPYLSVKGERVFLQHLTKKQAISKLNSTWSSKNKKEEHFKIREKAGLEGYRIHDIRHTYATNANSNGEKIEKTMEQMGHRDLKQHMVYVHPRDKDLEGVAERMEQVMAGQIFGDILTTPEASGAAAGAEGCNNSGKAMTSKQSGDFTFGQILYLLEQPIEEELRVTADQGAQGCVEALFGDVYSSRKAAQSGDTDKVATTGQSGISSFADILELFEQPHEEIVSEADRMEQMMMKAIFGEIDASKHSVQSEDTDFPLILKLLGHPRHSLFIKIGNWMKPLNKYQMQKKVDEIRKESK